MLRRFAVPEWPLREWARQGATDGKGPLTFNARTLEGLLATGAFIAAFSSAAPVTVMGHISNTSLKR
jgi:hypothetical protein